MIYGLVSILDLNILWSSASYANLQRSMDFNMFSRHLKKIGVCLSLQLESVPVKVEFCDIFLFYYS